MYWVAVVGVILLSTLSSQSRSTANNNNYKINPKPCWVNGLEGTCMFVWECINSEGRHVGMCVDTFMFGSCCAHNLTTNQLDMLPDPSEPAVLFTQPKLPQQHQRPNNNNNNNNVNNHNKPQVTAATAPVSRPYANTHTNTADLHSTSRPTSSHAYGHSQSPSSGTHGHSQSPSSGTHGHSQSPSSWTFGHSQSPSSWTSGHSQSPSSGTSGHSQSPSSGTSGDSPFNVNTVLAVNNNKPGRPNLSNEISSHHHHHYNQLGPPEPHPPPQLAMYNGGGGYNDRDRNHNNNSHSHSHSHSHLHSHSHNHFRPHNDLVNSDDSDNDINVNGDSHHSSYHHHRPHHNHHHHSHSYGGGLYSVNNRTMELERPMSNDLVMGLGRPGPAGATHSSTSHPHDHVTSDNVAASTSPSMSSPLTTTSFVSVSSSRPMLSPFNGGSIPSTLTHSGTKPQFVTYQFTTTTSAPLSSHKPSWNLTLLDSMNEIDDGSNKQSTESSWFRPRPSWYVTSQPFVTRPRPSSGIRPVKPQRPNYQSQSQSPHTISTSSSSSTSPSSSPSTSMSMSPSTSPSTTTMSTTTASPSPSTVASTTEAPSMVVFSSLPLVVTASDNKKKPQSPQPSSVSSSGSGTPVSASSHKGTMCGSSPLHPKHEVRIVGGRNAQFGVWPWQVSVRRTSFFGFSSTHRCGGALLNENWIATAGHCVDDLLASQIRIRVGEYDFSSVQEPYPFAERGVSKKMVHPKYNFFTYEYDLAMVRLDSPLEFAPHIIPICLPGSDDLLIGENATVTGWGRLSEGGTLPSVLQEVSVPIMSNEKCKSMFLRAGRHEFIPDIFMCAGFDDGGRDSCQGDSGGPLQVRGKDGKYFLAGIISWGIGCAEANLPGVCTRISKFVPWILETVT